MRSGRPFVRCRCDDTPVTVAVSALAVVLILVVGAAAAVVGRAWRAGERRERALVELLKERDRTSLEVLDRMMFAAGKTWKDTADRPEPERELELPSAVIEDPSSGASYSDPLSDLEASLFPGNEGDFIEPMLVDTREVDSSL